MAAGAGEWILLIKDAAATLSTFYLNSTFFSAAQGNANAGKRKKSLARAIVVNM